MRTSSQLWGSDETVEGNILSGRWHHCDCWLCVSLLLYSTDTSGLQTRNQQASKHRIWTGFTLGQFAGNKQFLNRLAQIPYCHCSRRTEKTHLKQRREFKWPAPPWVRPAHISLPPSSSSSEGLSPRSPRADGLTDLGPQGLPSQPSSSWFSLRTRSRRCQGRCAVGDLAGLGSTAGRLADFCLWGRERPDRVWMRTRVHHCQGQTPALLSSFVPSQHAPSVCFPRQSFSSPSACPSPLRGPQSRGVGWGLFSGHLPSPPPFFSSS